MKLKYGTNTTPVTDSAAYQREYRRRQDAASPDYKIKVNKYCRDYTARIRAEVQKAYGGKCSCCGETEPAFLTIDHPNNDGAKHRKQISNTALMYKTLKRLGFPKEYRLQCYNCNCGRARSPNKVCPHELKRQKKI